MPAVVKRTVGSFSGMTDAPEIWTCPFDTKKSMNNFLSSFAVKLFMRTNIIIYMRICNITALCAISPCPAFSEVKQAWLQILPDCLLSLSGTPLENPGNVLCL